MYNFRQRVQEDTIPATFLWLMKYMIVVILRAYTFAVAPVCRWRVAQRSGRQANTRAYQARHSCQDRRKVGKEVILMEFVVILLLSSFTRS